MVLRVRSTPTRFPTNILSTPVDSTPLHSIPSVWCPRGKLRLWGGGCCGNNRVTSFVVKWLYLSHYKAFRRPIAMPSVFSDVLYSEAKIWPGGCVPRVATAIAHCSNYTADIRLYLLRSIHPLSLINNGQVYRFWPSDHLTCLHTYALRSLKFIDCYPEICITQSAIRECMWCMRTQILPPSYPNFKIGVFPTQNSSARPQSTP